MQVRVDDDMRAIVFLTAEEYARFGGTKELVAQGIELTIGAELAGSAAAEAPIAEAPETGSDSAPAVEEPKSEPAVVTETVPEPQTI